MSDIKESFMERFHNLREEKKVSLRQHLKQRMMQDPDGIGHRAAMVSAPPKPKKPEGPAPKQ